MKPIDRTLRVLFGIALAGAALAAAALAYYAWSGLEIGPAPIQFSLKAGSGLRGAAQQMTRAGVLARPEPFVILARLLGQAGNVKAGNYEIVPPLTHYQLLKKITQGDVTMVSVKFVEGWTFRQMRRALDENPAVKHETKDLSDAEILKRLNIGTSSPEGWFFPDTYYFDEGTSDLAILRRAYRLMQTYLAAQWAQRAANLPYANPYEALILASIVEKETGKAEERALVAAVFVNRLRRGMRLQADPTVIYGMSEAFDGNIRKRDLTADTPYNTYTREGLPPTPIAMPGMASLIAALNPSDSDVLYFVSKGDGSSYFSRTQGEHERAVAKYQRSGRH